ALRKPPQKACEAAHRVEVFLGQQLVGNVEAQVQLQMQDQVQDQERVQVQVLVQAGVLVKRRQVGMVHFVLEHVVDFRHQGITHPVRSHLGKRGLGRQRFEVVN